MTQLKVLLCLFLPLLTACDSGLFLSDTDKLMKDITGEWSIDGCDDETRFGETLVSDSVYTCVSGSIDFAQRDGNEYTGSINITWKGSTEQHNIKGSTYLPGSDLEKVWIETDDGADINAFKLYSGISSINECYLENRQDDSMTLYVTESVNGYSLKRSFELSR